MSQLIDKISSLIPAFSCENSFKIDSFEVRQLIAAIYKAIEAIISIHNHQTFRQLFQGSCNISSVIFINSRPFLANYFEKALLWLILELFHCKSLVSSLRNFIFLNESPEVEHLLSTISELLDKNKVYIANCSLFREYESFLSAKPDPEVEKLREEWAKIKRNREEIEQHVTISQNPMVLTLSENSSEEELEEELVFFEEKEKKKQTKNKSRTVYRQLYKKMNENCKIILESQPNRLRDQDSQCWSCKKPISKGFLSLGGNARFCNYFNRWFCHNCISITKLPIPAKILTDFDFTLYEVSIPGYQELQAFLRLPLITIPYELEIVRKDADLYETLILRREVHLIFETICNPDLIKILLGEHMNLVMKENLFSLQNLLDIKAGKLKKVIFEVIQLGKEHFRQCPECIKTTNACPTCSDHTLLFFFEIRKTKVCRNCRKVFHMKCFMEKGCQECGLLSLMGQI